MRGGVSATKTLEAMLGEHDGYLYGARSVVDLADEPVPPIRGLRPGDVALVSDLKYFCGQPADRRTVADMECATCKPGR